MDSIISCCLLSQVILAIGLAAIGPWYCHGNAKLVKLKVLPGQPEVS
jgi:hypothetical protein